MRARGRGRSNKSHGCNFYRHAGWACTYTDGHVLARTSRTVRRVDLSP